MFGNQVYDKVCLWEMARDAGGGGGAEMPLNRPRPLKVLAHRQPICKVKNLSTPLFLRRCQRKKQQKFIC